MNNNKIDKFLETLSSTGIPLTIKQDLHSLINKNNPDGTKNYHALMLRTHDDKIEYNPLLQTIAKLANEIKNEEKLPNFSLSKEAKIITKLTQKTSFIEEKTESYIKSYCNHWQKVSIITMNYWYNQLIKFSFQRLFLTILEKTTDLFFPEEIIIDPNREPDMDKVVDRKSSIIYIKNQNAYFKDLKLQYKKINTKINNHILSEKNESENFQRIMQFHYNNTKKELNKRLNGNNN